MLEASQLYCERDDRILFEGLDFSLSAGQAIQIQGANGSGKTTLLRILCGLNREYEGEIRWRGKPVQTVRADFCSSVFYLGHAPAINRTLSAAENLRWFCASRGMAAASGISDALAAVNLRGYDDVPCHMMSAGQQRRVSLARMHLVPAAVWILDEPFTALDKTGVSELEALLSGFVQKGGALLLTTHHALQMSCPVGAIDLDACKGQGERRGS